MEKKNTTPKAPRTPQVPVPPVPNRAETEMRAPGAAELEFPRPAEMELPGKVKPELQVGNFKPSDIGGFSAASPLGNFESEEIYPTNGTEN